MSYLFRYYAKVYDRFMGKFHLDDDAMILDIIGTGNKQIADIGGGTGKTADKLIRLGHLVTIIDPCQSMTRRAMKRNSKIQVINQSMPIELKEVYDVILFRDCLHHIKKQRETLQLCANKLREGGLIIIADFSPKSIKSKVIFCFERLCFEKIWEVDEKKLLKLLKGNNMSTQLIQVNDRDYIVIGRKNK